MRKSLNTLLSIVVVTLGLSALSAPAWAIPVQFTYTGTIGASAISGVNSGDAVTITVLADNGGASLIDQIWNAADLLSATLTAGSYSASYSTPLLSNLDPAFRTNLLGNLDQARFLGGIFGMNSDTFGTGGSTLLFDDTIQDFFGNAAFLNNPLSDSQSLGLWSGPSITNTPIPEPPTLALFAIAALAFRRIYKRDIAKPAAL